MSEKKRPGDDEQTNVKCWNADCPNMLTKYDVRMGYNHCSSECFMADDGPDDDEEDDLDWLDDPSW